MKSALRRLVQSRLSRAMLRRAPWVQAHAMKRARRIRNEVDATGGTSDADYCLHVWRHHLGYVHASFPRFRPRHVLELGPGDTIGVGLTALMGGAASYTAIDAQRYLNLDLTRRHADALARRIRAAPGAHRWFTPIAAADLDALAAHQAQGAAPTHDPDLRINYLAPLAESGIADALPQGHFDLCLSQAVLEHVPDPAAAYDGFFAAMAPGGVFSHEIDFRSHGMSYDWNGHWVYGERHWQIARNPLTFRDINRLPLSAHLARIEAAGFHVLSVDRARQASDLRRADLAPRWRDLSRDDLETAGAHVLAVKPG